MRHKQTVAWRHLLATVTQAGTLNPKTPNAVWHTHYTDPLRRCMTLLLQLIKLPVLCPVIS